MPLNESTPLRIGTRGSRLALSQANLVIEALKDIHPILRENGAVQLVVIKTTGDRIQSELLAQLGGKGLFTKELDNAMLDDRIDIAIHSMKDVPTYLPDGIVLHAVMPREDARDAFISFKAPDLESLPQGSRLGTASLRRKSQVLNLRPDLKVMPFRGNIETRLDKLKAGEVDATLLALAGLKRTGKEDVATSVIETTTMLPAVGQGTLAATCREDDPRANAMLAPLAEPANTAATLAERAMLAVLDGSCHTPIAGLAEPDGQGNLILRGMIARPDGAEKAFVSMRAPITDAENLGKNAAEDLLQKAGPSILGAIEAETPNFIRPHPDMKQEG